jgi:uncharacterized protein (DUF427 family)
MKAIVDGSVVADAPESDLISIEGNFYFPPSSIGAGVLSDSPTPYTCPWKGVAQYHDISVGGSTHHDAAWSYPVRTRLLSAASARTTAVTSPSTSGRSRSPNKTA